MKKALLFGALTLLAAPLLGATFANAGENGADAPAVRVISQAQYVNTIRMIFGSGLSLSPKFAPVPRVDGLVAAGSSGATMTGGALDQFDAAARAVAEQVVSPANRDFLVPCRPKSDTAPDDRCAGEFLGRVGGLLFRRPFTPAETKAYAAIAHKAAASVNDFYRGLGVTLATLLVAPEFLYVTQPVETSRGVSRLTAWGKASRLSLLLWNAYPDDELLKAAASGALNTPEGLAAQVDRMLASPRLEAGVRNFFDDMLVFENFDTLAKDPGTFPAFTHKVGEDAREQTLRTIVAHIVQDDADYRDLFTTRKTFLTNDLGSIYGVSVDDPKSWTRYEFPPGDPHAGILTQLSFTAIYAHPGRTSATRRGKAIREVFLCQKVPNPPANVDFSKLENPDPALKTTRQRMMAHQSNPVCAGCHRITDPIGFALENFDGAGFFRAEESKAAIDASGQLDGVSFADQQGLSRALHDNPRVPACLTQRLLSYAVGRPLAAGDDAWAKQIGDDFAGHGYRVKQLLRTIALSDGFTALEAAKDPAAEDRAAKDKHTKQASDNSNTVPKQGS